jgi:flagellar hook-associated protein 2
LSISFGSIGTGLPKDIVQQLLKAEQVPIEQLQVRKAKIENKKKLLEELSGHVSSLRDNLGRNKSAKEFRELKVKTDDKLVGVTIDKAAAIPGSYKLEVLELAEKTSVITNGVPDKDDTYIGVGYIEYELPNGDVKEVFIDPEHGTLSGIAKAINEDPDNGMQATVVNDGIDPDAPFRLIISIEGTGEGNQASFPYLYFIDGEMDLFLEGERTAKNARIKLDGFEMSVPSNKLNDLIPGVTLDLKKAVPGEEVNIEITEDAGKVTEKFNEMIESINKVLTFINQQNNLDENSDTSSSLGGDLTLQTLQSRIRSAIFTGIKTRDGVKRLSDLGISFQRDGLLKFEQKRFENSISGDYRAASEILIGAIQEDGTKSKGFFDNLYDVANLALRQPGGTIGSRKRGLISRINQIDRQIEQKERLVEQKEQILKRRFSRLEETMSRIKSQGQGLAGIGGGQNANIIQQLG